MPKTAMRDIALYRGDDWHEVYTFKSPDLVTGPNPYGLVDWTGCAVAAQVRATPGSSAVLYTMGAAFSGTPTDGTISVSIASSSGLLAGNYAWDLQVTDSLGKVHTWIAGRVVVTQDTTRS